MLKNTFHLFWIENIYYEKNTFHSNVTNYPIIIF